MRREQEIVGVNIYFSTGLIVVAVIVILVIRTRFQPTRAGHSFTDYVKDPSLRSSVQQGFVERDQEIVRLSKLDPYVLVEKLLDETSYQVVELAIQRVGGSASPALAAAVSDPRFRVPARNSSSKTKAWYERSEPLENVLSCLAEAPSPDAVPAVAALLADPSSDIRKAAAMVLGATANNAAAEPTARSLSDKDPYVRSYAMMGILRAITAGRATQGFRDRVFEALEPLVTQRDSTVSGNAPQCLLGLDRRRAIDFLTSDQILSPGTEGLQYTLRALHEAEAPVADQPLLRIVRALEANPTEYPNDYVLEWAIRLLARSNSHDAKAEILKAANSPSPKVIEAAIQATLDSMGIANPFAIAFDKIDNQSWDNVHPSIAHVAAVRVLIDEVENGGLSQYFVNSSGAYWQFALNGLRAIGAKSDVQILQEALDMFEHSNPSTHNEQRHSQLAQIIRKDEKAFDGLNSRFYDDKDVREALLLRYVSANSQHFKKQ